MKNKILLIVICAASMGSIAFGMEQDRTIDELNKYKSDPEYITVIGTFAPTKNQLPNLQQQAEQQIKETEDLSKRIEKTKSDVETQAHKTEHLEARIQENNAKIDGIKTSLAIAKTRLQNTKTKLHAQRQNVDTYLDEKYHETFEPIIKNNLRRIQYGALTLVTATFFYISYCIRKHINSKNELKKQKPTI